MAKKTPIVKNQPPEALAGTQTTTILTPLVNYVVDVVGVAEKTIGVAVDATADSLPTPPIPADAVFAHIYPNKNTVPTLKPPDANNELFQFLGVGTTFFGTVSGAVGADGPPSALPEFRLAVWSVVWDVNHPGDWNFGTWQSVFQNNFGHQTAQA